MVSTGYRFARWCIFYNICALKLIILVVEAVLRINTRGGGGKEKTFLPSSYKNI